jgi:hypothetical protein
MLQEHQRLGMKLLNDGPEEGIRKCSEHWGMAHQPNTMCSVHPVGDGTYVLRGPNGTVNLPNNGRPWQLATFVHTMGYPSMGTG